MGYPNSWMVHTGKSQCKIDDDWGYPHFAKPPSISDENISQLVYLVVHPTNRKWVSSPW